MDADGARAGGGLPEGFVEVYGGPPPGGAEALAERATVQLWSPPAETGGPRWATLSVYEGLALSLDSVAWTLPGGRRTEVAGRPAVVQPGMGAIAWSPRAGVLVVLTAGGYVEGPAPGARSPAPAERELLDLAERVVPVEEAAWRGLVRGLTGPQARDVPRPLGREGTVVATGGEGTQAWTARASVDGDEVCLDVTTATGGSGTCGPRPSPRQIAGVGTSGNLVTAILGEGVAGVEVQLSSGDPVVVETVSAPGVPAAFAVAHLPTGAVPLTLVTRDGAGRELARHDVAPPPAPAPLPGGPPPVTAPAAPPPPALVPPPGPCPSAPCGWEAAPTTIAVPPVAVTATTTVGG